jgi:hypothetical protein
VPNAADDVRLMEARYGRLHNISMAVLAIGMAAIAVFFLARGSPQGIASGSGDPRFMLYLVLVVAMAFYAWLGYSRFANREPQLVIDHDGIVLGFGRNRRFRWNEIQWVRVRRLGFRPQLQIGVAPEAFVAADLRLSTWSLDDGLRPVRGTPAAVAVRDNGLDTRTSAMFDAVKSFRPNLVRP